MRADLAASVSTYLVAPLADFHAKRLAKLQELSLKTLVNKNPYLIRVKNLTSAPDLVDAAMSAYLSSSEETTFGNLLEGLAVHIAGFVYGGVKSGVPGVDLEFTRDGVRYLVALKSSVNWGNALQSPALTRNLQGRQRTIRQNQAVGDIRCVEAMYCGKRHHRKITDTHMKVSGQSFWEFISGEPDLYIEIIEPLAANAQEQSQAYQAARAAAHSRLSAEFYDVYCFKDEGRDGQIDWARLVAANSGNIPQATAELFTEEEPAIVKFRARKRKIVKVPDPDGE